MGINALLKILTRLVKRNPAKAKEYMRLYRGIVGKHNVSKGGMIKGGRGASSQLDPSKVKANFASYMQAKINNPERLLPKETLWTTPKDLEPALYTRGKGNLLEFKVPLDYLKKHGVKRVDNLGKGVPSYYFTKGLPQEFLSKTTPINKKVVKSVRRKLIRTDKGFAQRDRQAGIIYNEKRKEQILHKAKMALLNRKYKGDKQSIAEHLLKEHFDSF